jgi:hypothetical protein
MHVLFTRHEIQARRVILHLGHEFSADTDRRRTRKQLNIVASVLATAMESTGYPPGSSGDQ